jgi:hypothetical protein
MVTAASAMAGTDAPDAQRDLFFGEALYSAFQEEWFDAIARLDTELALYHGLDEPGLDSLHIYIDQAEFDVGDFELAYRMHQRAGRAITSVIEGHVEETVRNEAIYRLARIYFQKNRPVEALAAIERISGSVSPENQDDVAFLRAQILMANERYEDAGRILKDLRESEALEGFSTYNLGIALIREGDETAGRAYLDETGRIQTDATLTLALKDKSNLVLGTKLMDEGNFEGAKQVLDRVRLEGPFSNRALLGSGWADASRELFEDALVPWSLLAKREVTDEPVQEALLAVAYAYGKLNVFSKAALMYGEALAKFGSEIDRLDDSIVSVREGYFLEALVREEIKQDSDWVVKLRALPQAPETYYLLELMASHDFQESLKNYLDLEELRKKLVSWQGDLDAFEDLIEKRRAYYEPLIPDIDRKFRELDSQMRLRLEQRDRIEKRLKAMLVVPRPDYLATSEERKISERIALLDAQAGVEDETVSRIDRLIGVLHWNIYTDYDRRFTEASEHLRDLNHEVDLLNRQYTAFVRTRQAATQSYEGYDETIRSQRIRIRTALETVETLMARQGQMLEAMAVSELSRRRERLAELQIKARFAMADSYDRATRVQTLEKAEP